VEKQVKHGRVEKQVVQGRLCDRPRQACEYTSYRNPPRGRPGHFCTTATLAAITARTTNGSNVPGEISLPAVTAITHFAARYPSASAQCRIQWDFGRMAGLLHLFGLCSELVGLELVHSAAVRAEHDRAQ
jgi:hypothetical protein